MKTFLIIALFSVSCYATDPHAYPVPFTPNRNPAHTQITFKDVPAEGTIKIFTINGVKVREVSIPTGAGVADWDGKTSDGKNAATGVYFYDVNGEFQGKLVIIR